MENINFIPAKELPVAEGDEVSVLCLENGEMKQKPGASLGGGGGYIMKPTAEEVSSDGTVITITANADELAKVLEAGGAVSIRLPMSAMSPELAALIPYAVASLHAWSVFPAGAMGEGSPQCLVSCLHLLIMGEGPSPFMVVFPNITYIPNLE